MKIKGGETGTEEETQERRMRNGGIFFRMRGKKVMNWKKTNTLKLKVGTTLAILS